MSLLLNFSPIEFTDTEVEAGVFPYCVDGERVLKQLRQQNWATHVFRREGPDQIIAVPVTANAQTLGESTKKIRLKENLGLTASLIRNSIINFLAGLPRTVLGYDPIRFIAQDDILRSCLPSDLTCPDWLGVRLLYEIAIRPIYFFKHEPFIAAVLDVRTTRILERTVADLLADGLSPAGHYVAKRVSKYQDPRIALHSELVGKVQSVTASDPQIRSLKVRNQRAGAAAVCRFVWAGLIANVIKTSGPRAAHKGRTYGPTAPV